MLCCSEEPKNVSVQVLQGRALVLRNCRNLRVLLLGELLYFAKDL
jgi:hypothetical protein